MATRVKKVNQWYIKYATQNLILSMDDSSLYCEVVSESNENVMYHVEMNEETMVATSCNCPAYTRCKHMDIADTLQYKVAPVEAPVVEETTITEVERKQWYVVNHAHQVWCQDGTWMCAEGAEFVEMVMKHLGIEQPAPVVRKQVWDKDLCTMIYLDNREIVDPVAHAAAIKAQNESWAELIELEDQMSLVRDTSVLNGAQQSAGVLMALPSRKAKAS